MYSESSLGTAYPSQAQPRRLSSSLTVFGGVHIAHLFNFYVVFFLTFFCLHSVSIHVPNIAVPHLADHFSFNVYLP
jgi:hypothetical protein